MSVSRVISTNRTLPSVSGCGMPVERWESLCSCQQMSAGLAVVAALHSTGVKLQSPVLVDVTRAMNSQYLNGSMNCAHYWASVHPPFGESVVVMTSLAFYEIERKCQHGMYGKVGDQWKVLWKQPSTFVRSLFNSLCFSLFLNDWSCK